MAISINILATVVYIILLESSARGSDDVTGTTISTPIPNNNLTSLNSAREETSDLFGGQMTDFSKSFMGYERRIRSFIDNVRRGYMAMNTNASEFLEELRGYMEQLPKNQTKTVTVRYRSKCHCDGEIREPCPERCMDSCYGYGYINGYNCCSRKYYNNCTSEKQDRTLSNCLCSENSGISCEGGMDACYEEKTEVVPVDAVRPCQEFTLDQSTVEESFLHFTNLLLEPLKILVRDLEFQVSSFKQALIATDLLYNITAQLCETQETACFPEATELLEQKLQFFKQRKRNITLEMIKTQEQAELVTKNVHILKEQVFAQISQSVRNYTCCLKSFNFTVEDNDCNPKPLPEVTTTTIKSPLFSLGKGRRKCGMKFECENEMCVSPTVVCDGYDDCGDMSDEKDC